MIDEEDEIQKNNKIVEKLRNENHGQFLTLCRMHLSFEINLELDGNESFPEKPKSKLWNKFQKKTNKCTAILPSPPQLPLLTQMSIDQISKLIIFLKKEESTYTLPIHLDLRFFYKIYLCIGIT